MLFVPLTKVDNLVAVIDIVLCHAVGRARVFSDRKTVEIVAMSVFEGRGESGGWRSTALLEEGS